MFAMFTRLLTHRLSYTRTHAATTPRMAGVFQLPDGWYYISPYAYDLGNNQVQLAWREAHNGGSAITKYQYSYYDTTVAPSERPTQTWVDIPDTDPPPGVGLEPRPASLMYTFDNTYDSFTKYHTVTGLSPGTYVFEVRPVNGVGVGEPARSNHVTTSASAPAESLLGVGEAGHAGTGRRYTASEQYSLPPDPDFVVTATPGDTEVTLSWPAENAGDEEITGYAYARWQVSATDVESYSAPYDYLAENYNWFDGSEGSDVWTAITGTDPTSVTVTGLINSEGYFFWLRKTNAAGHSVSNYPGYAKPTSMTTSNQRVAEEPDPLTASFHDLPATHDGTEFTFEFRLSEDVSGLSPATVRDSSITVSGATIEAAQRKTAGSNQDWTGT